MTTIREALSAATAMTITLDALASSQTVGRSSLAVDNSTNLYLDALVEVKIVFPNTAPANDKSVYVFGYGSLDGTNYSEAVAGTDVSYTIDNPTGLPLLGVIPAVQNVTRRSRPMSILNAFGFMPTKWGIVVVNFSGQTLGTGCAAQFTGLTATAA